MLYQASLPNDCLIILLSLAQRVDQSDRFRFMEMINLLVVLFVQETLNNKVRQLSGAHIGSDIKFPHEYFYINNGDVYAHSRTRVNDYAYRMR